MKIDPERIPPLEHRPRRARSDSDSRELAGLEVWVVCVLSAAWVLIALVKMRAFS
ncbi:MAG: hypothetical protein KDC87_12220 [Planctomycetes bacterium]|nr:hypothetical protein [Planctomycetota bacterium]